MQINVDIKYYLWIITYEKFVWRIYFMQTSVRYDMSSATIIKSVTLFT